MPTIKLATKDDIQALDEAKSDVNHGHAIEEVAGLPDRFNKLENDVYKKGEVLSADTKALYNKDESAKPDDIFDCLHTSAVAMSSYLTFVGNVNADMLDAGFGKNNEDNVKGLGKALVMYSKFKGNVSNMIESFPKLINKNSFDDILNDDDSFKELFVATDLVDLIKLSPYAYPKYLNRVDKITSDEVYYYAINSYDIDTNDFPTLTSMFADSIVFEQIANDNFIASYIFGKNDCMTALFDNAEITEPIINASSVAMSVLTSRTDLLQLGQVNTTTMTQHLSGRIAIVKLYSASYASEEESYIQTCAVGDNPRKIEKTSTTYFNYFAFVTDLSVRTTGSARYFDCYYIKLED